MKLSIFSVGKANESYIKEGVEQFTKRIGHYYPIDWQLITPSKLTEPAQIKKAEAASILKAMAATDVLILLDEKGKMLSSWPSQFNPAKSQPKRTENHILNWWRIWCR